MKHAKQIIAVSNFTKDEIKTLFPQLKTPIKTIYEGVSDLGTPEPANRIKSLAKPYVLSVGSAYPHKNLELTIATLVPYLRERGMVYVLAGREDYFMMRVKRWVEKKHYDDVVHFFGEATDGELATLYQKSRALIFMSKYEGFGLPALEAMQYSCPVIASDQGSLPEIVKTAGIVVPLKDISKLSKAVDNLLRDDVLRDNLTKLGRKRAKKFSWDLMAKEVEILYNII